MAIKKGMQGNHFFSLTKQLVSKSKPEITGSLNLFSLHP
jgi:hypothetical protein